jgi:hypothetical protein
MSVTKQDERIDDAVSMRRRYEADRKNFATMTDQGVDYELLNALVADNYSGSVYLSNGTQYLAPTTLGQNGGKVHLQDQPYTWILQRFWVQKVNRWGKAIYKSDSQVPGGECWTNTLIDPGQGPYADVIFWNAEGHGGVPDDGEHFHFEYVDSIAGTVRIRDYQDYVYLEQGSDDIGIGASPSVAASFFVQFQQQIDMQMRNLAVAAALNPHNSKR